MQLGEQEVERSFIVLQDFASARSSVQLEIRARRMRACAPFDRDERTEDRVILQSHRCQSEAGPYSKRADHADDCDLHSVEGDEEVGVVREAGLRQVACSCIRSI